MWLTIGQVQGDKKLLLDARRSFINEVIPLLQSKLSDEDMTRRLKDAAKKWSQRSRREKEQSRGKE